MKLGKECPSRARQVLDRMMAHHRIVGAAKRTNHWPAGRISAQRLSTGGVAHASELTEEDVVMDHPTAPHVVTLVRTGVMAALAGLLMVGCAASVASQPRPEWSRPAATTQQLNLDRYACEKENSTRVLVGYVWDIGKIKVDRDMFQSCMRARGWLHADDPAPVRPAEVAVPDPGELTGTYVGVASGRVRGEPFQMAVTFTLAQSGMEATGTWTTTGGSSGHVVVQPGDGRTWRLRALQVNPCQGAFTGSLVQEAGGAGLRGQYAGSDCTGSVSAAFEVQRR
jgi:hypothetical protein